MAQGIVTANPGKALEGLAELAPEDSTAQTALEGLTAALQGDVLGAASAVAELAGGSEVAEDTKQRLEQLQSIKQGAAPDGATPRL